MREKLFLIGSERVYDNSSNSNDNDNNDNDNNDSDDINNNTFPPIQ